MLVGAELAAVVSGRISVARDDEPAGGGRLAAVGSGPTDSMMGVGVPGVDASVFGDMLSVGMPSGCPTPLVSVGCVILLLARSLICGAGAVIAVSVVVLVPASGCMGGSVIGIPDPSSVARAPGAGVAGPSPVVANPLLPPVSPAVADPLPPV